MDARVRDRSVSFLPIARRIVDNKLAATIRIHFDLVSPIAKTQCAGTKLCGTSLNNIYRNSTPSLSC